MSQEPNLNPQRSVLQDCHPLQIPFESPGFYLDFSSTDYKSKIPMACLGSVNFRVAHRTQRNVFLLHYWFIVKECNAGTTRWKRCIVWVCSGNGVQSFQVRCGWTIPSDSPHVNQPGASQNHIPLGFLWQLHCAVISHSVMSDSLQPHAL